MAEAAGLVLAVIPLIPGAIQACKRCSELFHDLRNHPGSFRLYETLFNVERRQLEDVCKHILRDFYGEEEACRMLEDMDHPQWKSIDSEERPFDSLDSTQQDMLSLTLATLQRIEERMYAVRQKLDEFDSRPCSSPRSIKALKNLPSRVGWAFSWKSDVNKDLKVLRKQTETLWRLRTRRFTPEVASTVFMTRNCPTKSTAHTKSSLEIVAVRDFSQRLYECIRPTVCTCHQLNLRLDKSGTAETGAKFHLVITPDPATTQTTCPCLLITTEVEAKAKVLYISPENTPPSHASPKSALRSIVSSHVSQAKPKTRVAFSHSHAANESKDTRKHAAETSPSTICDPQASGVSPALIITKLCSLLQGSLEQRDSGNSPVYLGLLGSGFETAQAYKHSVYREQYGHPSSYRMSLSELFTDADKSLLIPRKERIRIAFVLAMAMLQYGSFTTSWFREHWRSRDIFFFFDRQKRLQEELSTMDPHVIAPFSEGAPSDPEPPPRAKNNQLSSLAIVLTEIAYGKPLRDIRDLKNIKGSDRIWEELKVDEIVRSRMLAKKINHNYAKVVEDCIKWDFGDGDLDKKEVQDAFYTYVVKPLEGCLNCLDE